MARTKVEPVTVAKWGAVGIGLYALGNWLGVWKKPGDEPLVDPDDVNVELVPPLMSRAYARTLADRIYSAIYGSGGFWGGSVPEDEQAVVDALLEVNTTGDAALLVDEYGVRGGVWTLTGDLDLPGAIRTYLSASDIETVNTDYRRRNIEWSW